MERNFTLISDGDLQKIYIKAQNEVKAIAEEKHRRETLNPEKYGWENEGAGSAMINGRDAISFKKIENGVHCFMIKEAP